MKITIEPSDRDAWGRTADCIHSKITIEHPYDDLSLDDAMRLVQQALLAYGFSEGALNCYFGEQ